MKIKLLVGAITKFILGVALVSVMIFLPAGTCSYFNGYRDYKQKVKFRLIPFIW